MQVELFKKVSTYIKDGEEKIATNFFLRCGDTLVPIEVRFFEDKKTGQDRNYSGRKLVLSSFAAVLPDKPQEKSDVKNKTPYTAKPQELAQGELPFNSSK